MSNVFGVLNKFISRLDSDQPLRPATSSYGFQVLKNTNTELPIDPWFDYVIGINGRNIDNSDATLFATEVRNCAGSNLNLGIYSSKGQQIRELQTQVTADAPSLGLSLQWSPLSATEDVWHILDVTPNSPADVAGLLSYSDYVVGSPEGLMRGEHGLAELVQDFMNRALRLYVYNNEYDVTRIVTLTPARGWGGDGALGCLLGFGALHRLPAPLTEPSNAPGETMFDTAGSTKPSPAMPSGAFASPRPSVPPSPSFFVPAEMKLPPNAQSAVGSTAPPRGAKKARAHHPVSPGAAMDDYFKEGEEKSKLLDGTSTPAAPTGAVVGPPPKGGAGPPPRSSEVPTTESESKDAAAGA